jgi:hypothetical protein
VKKRRKSDRGVEKNFKEHCWWNNKGIAAIDYRLLFLE